MRDQNREVKRNGTGLRIVSCPLPVKKVHGSIPWNRIGCMVVNVREGKERIFSLSILLFGYFFVTAYSSYASANRSTVCIALIGKPRCCKPARICIRQPGLPVTTRSAAVA